MLQLLLFTPLSSTVYLVIYRSGQLEKTNNILNAKTHAELLLLVRSPSLSHESTPLLYLCLPCLVSVQRLQVAPAN